MMDVCFFAPGLPPPRELSFGNEGYCNVTSSAKIPIFSVADDDFPFRQCCMKPYSKKNLNDDEILFNYRLSKKRRVTENVFEIWINRFRIFANRATFTRNRASVVAMDISAG